LQSVLNLVADRQVILFERSHCVAAMPPVQQEGLIQKTTTTNQRGVQANPAVVHGDIVRKWQHIVEYFSVKSHTASHERVVYPVPDKTGPGTVHSEK